MNGCKTALGAVESQPCRVLGVRIIRGAIPAEGEVLPNSWHPSGECDWLEQDTELDGTACFEVQAGESAGKDLNRAIDLALPHWPSAPVFALVGGDRRGDAARDGGLPEDGAILVPDARVLAVWEREGA